MGTTKQCVFNLYFNCRGNKEREWAEKTRDGALAHLKRLFENKAKFSCIAKDENQTSLMLRGHVNLNSPCTLAYAKRTLGKCSSSKLSYFGDMVSLCRLVHIDRDLTVIGRLPKVGGNSASKMKPFAADPKFVKRILLESIDKDITATTTKVDSTGKKLE